MNFLRTVSALEDYNEVKQHQASNLLQELITKAIAKKGNSVTSLSTLLFCFPIESTDFFAIFFDK